MKVLLVNDDGGVRDALVLAGHEVEVAGTAEQGLALVAASEPDAVLVDPDMKLDGFEFCSWLRATGNRVPVVVLTTQGRPEDRVAGLDAGADDYLVKPFDLGELEARLYALARRTKWRTLPSAPRG